jgi:YD repeat-containing protein
MSSAHSRACALLLCALAPVIAPAATTSYEYDALGRLRVVTHDNRTVTTYTLDPAGNRTLVTDVPLGPTSAPASISVPASSTTGEYSVTWGAATGTVLTYELFESTSPSFASSTRVHNAATRTASFSGKPNNSTYYYRVRACASGDCSGFATGANGVAVFVAPPGAPASITVPSSNTTGAYAISWSAASGAVQNYELYESTSPSFSPATLVRSDAQTSMAFTEKAHGTYYYRVRACGRGGCSEFTQGATGVTVYTPPPGAPATIAVPASSSTGAYAITWSDSTGSVQVYELYESTSSSFSTATLVLSDALTSMVFAGKPHGSTYYYRVRACGRGGCSDFVAGANGVTTTYPPPAPPASIYVPSEAPYDYYAEWGASAGYVSTYELYESTSATFATQSLKYSGAERTVSIREMPNGTYYYRVRGCGVGGCSDYRVASNPAVVNRPPPAPAMPTNLAKTHIANCAWRATWNAVVGAANYIVRDTAGAEQTVTGLIAHVACPINNQNANQPRWVKACSSAGHCSTAAYFP